MTKSSNNNGRAYEYICTMVFSKEIGKHRKTKVIENTSLLAAKKAWDSLDSESQDDLKKGAMCVVDKIFELEPLMLEGSDELELMIQRDSKGEEGDVRDVLILRSSISWEIGFSLKHNHFAIKHSRLSMSIDFGEKWYGHKCSKTYFDEIKPLFDSLESMKERRMRWNQIPNKEGTVYKPLLNAFMKEIKRASKAYPNMPRKMVEYLLGIFDYYKLICLEDERKTSLYAFNLRGELNKNGERTKRKVTIPVTSFPTRLVQIEYKPGSSTTLEMYMDNGWQFSFRIHNASSIVENSLKFDIQPIGMPVTIIRIDRYWS